MITARDRKIMFILIPLVVFAGYWFMVLAPKRAESQKVSTELTKAQSARDSAEQQVAQLNTAKASFATDYATVLRLGKAVPTTVDMPSLLVQLDRAARGTGITINDLKPGATTDASSSAAGAGATSGTAPTTSPGGGTAPGGGNNPAAPGAPPAQSFPGKQAQKAGTGVTQANNTNQANANAQGGATSGPAGSSTPAPPGLQSVPLTITVDGTFFGLADFFHRMKRFVRVVNDQIVVRGRLLTIESFDFKKSQAAGGSSKILTADVTATIYLSPPSQGATAGATSSGPAPAAGATPSQPPASGTSTNPPTPAATATP